LQQGRVPAELAGTRVLVNGAPAPVLYAQAGQVNAILPFDLQPGASVLLEVEFEGRRQRLTGTVEPSVPGVVTSDGSGTGAVAALNQDGRVNSAANPAPLGSVVSVFLLGAGVATLPLTEGAIATSAGGGFQETFEFGMPGSPKLPVEYFGLSPGSITSLTQANVRLPSVWPAGEEGPAVSFSVRTSRGWQNTILYLRP
jgi:uncharacterized protein (TIGR03437 family)